MFNYIPVMLSIPDAPLADTKLACRSAYFSNAFSVKRHVVIANAVEKLNRHPDLDIWNDIKSSDGCFEFEVAVQLPFYLPKYREDQEYALRFDNKEYIISNRHCEIIIDESHDKFLLAHVFAQEALVKQHGFRVNQVIMAKTLVITRFKVRADSASHAIEQYFGGWLSVLNRDIPLIISALRYYSIEQSYNMPDCLDVGKFCPVYVLCRGDGKQSLLRFVARIDAYQVQSLCNVSCDISELESFCNGTAHIDVCKVTLDRAQLFLHLGEVSMACVLACTACEILLTRELRSKLRRQGLSRSKENDALDRLSFSQMLNLLSYFLFDMTDEQIKGHVASINGLRKRRNEIVHQASWLPADSNDDIKKGIEAVQELRKRILS